MQVLIVEVFKIINGFAPAIIENFLLFHENTHNIWNFQITSDESKKTVRYGLEMVKYRTPFLRANLPEKCKTATSPNSFKTNIKTWKCEDVFRIFISSIFNRAFQPISARCCIAIPLRTSENATS